MQQENLNTAGPHKKLESMGDYCNGPQQCGCKITAPFGGVQSEGAGAWSDQCPH